MDYQEILKQAIDLHVHIGPEIIPRKFNLVELLRQEKGKLKGVAVKNHFFPTAPINTKDTLKQKSPFVINSVTLNHYVGGFNPDVIRASAELSVRPIIVWFPTIHAENILKKQKFEIPIEWIDPKLKKEIKLRLSKDIPGLSVLDNRGEIKKEVRGGLNTIKEYGAILATGHISWQESRVLVNFAIQKIGLKKVIITHPIYQKIDMPIEVQKELAKAGAFIEQCFSMYSIDRIPMKQIANQIKQVGPENCILSSDVGQSFNPNPSEALKKFIYLLKKEGITDEEIKIMLVINPNRLIKLKKPLKRLKY